MKNVTVIKLLLYSCQMWNNVIVIKLLSHVKECDCFLTFVKCVAMWQFINYCQCEGMYIVATKLNKYITVSNSHYFFSVLQSSDPTRIPTTPGCSLRCIKLCTRLKWRIFVRLCQLVVSCASCRLTATSTTTTRGTPGPPQRPPVWNRKRRNPRTGCTYFCL